MKNTMQYKNILTALTGLFVVFVLVVGVYSVTSLVPVAHAQEIGDGGDGGCDCGGGSSSLGVEYTYPASSPSYSEGVDYTYPASYDNGYNSYSPSYGASYLGGGYVSGGSYLPTAHSYPVTSAGGQTQTQSQSSNNTNVNNNIITVNTPAQTVTPAPVYNPPVYTYDICQNMYGIQTSVPAGYQLVNGNCIGYYNTATPYISLSEAPYTGLDLGFWGTIAYWGFLVLWCLVAAYLIVVKKIQNRVLSALNSFLFGSTTSHVVAVAAPAATVTYSAPAVTTQVDAIDDFILSQVNRGTRRS